MLCIYALLHGGAYILPYEPSFLKPSFTFHCLLRAAALLNWSLISLADLLAFIFIQYAAPKIGRLLNYTIFLDIVFNY